MTIALAVATISCTKSGLLESPKTYEDPITFEPYTGKATMTKATVADTDVIRAEGFNVLGFVQHGETIDSTNPDWSKLVTDIDKDNKWLYDGAVYWPDGDKLTFLAYGNNAAVVTPVNEDYTKLTYVVPPTVADQKDLVISPVKQNCTSEDPNGLGQNAGGPVSVQLYHALSRVGFSVRTEGNSTAVATIKQVSLKGAFVPSATFDLSKIAAPAQNVKTLTYNQTNFTPAAASEIIYNLFTEGDSFTTDGDPDKIEGETKKTYQIYNKNKSKDDRFMMIMPCTVGDNTTSVEEVGTKPYIEVIYVLTGAKEDIARIPLQVNKGTSEAPEYVNFLFEPGKAYEFIFTVSTVAVGFDVKVDIWQPTDGNSDNPQTVPVPEEFPLN